MLKGHVFKKQSFANHIFALFIDTFLNGRSGVSSKYGNKMQVTYSENNITVNSGAVCIKGRFIEEDSGTTILAGIDTAFCRLVIEIDLSKENTEEILNQATYKIIKGVTAYPALTQEDIIKNNNGIYQYELASFKTSLSGITEFADKRTYLDFETIYNYLENIFKTLRDEEKTKYENMLKQLKQILENTENGSAYLLKESGGVVKGKTIFEGGIEGNLTGTAREHNKV